LIKQVKQQYPNDVTVIYRHFPLSNIHPYAQLAAQASEVANQEGKFWEFHDRLFEDQETWATLSSQDEVLAQFVSYAEEFGIDKATFTEKINSDSVMSAVAQDVSLATQLNVNATPTIYLNGQKVSAPQQLFQLVDDLLKTE
jgi:protein-disulfide isomerase